MNSIRKVLEEFKKGIQSLMLDTPYELAREEELVDNAQAKIHSLYLSCVPEGKCHIIRNPEKKFKCDTCSCRVEGCRLSGWNACAAKTRAKMQELEGK